MTVCDNASDCVKAWSKYSAAAADDGDDNENSDDDAQIHEVQSVALRLMMAMMIV